MPSDRAKATCCAPSLVSAWDCWSSAATCPSDSPGCRRSLAVPSICLRYLLNRGVIQQRGRERSVAQDGSSLLGAELGCTGWISTVAHGGFEDLEGRGHSQSGLLDDGRSFEHAFETGHMWPHYTESHHTVATCCH